MRLLISLDGTDVQVDRRLVRFSDRVADASPAFEQIITRLERIEDKQFSTQGGYGSAGWQDLADSTKQAKGGRGDILVNTGDLRDGLTGDGPDALREVTPSSMVFGTTNPVARFHQSGTSRMPARPPLELPETDRRDLPKILQLFFVRQERAL